MAQDNVITDAETTDSSSDLSWELPTETVEPSVETAPSAEVEAPPAEPPPETPAVTVPFVVPEILRPPAPETQGGMTLDEQTLLQSELTELRRVRDETLQIQRTNKQATALEDEVRELINLYNMDEQSARIAATRVLQERQRGEDRHAEAEANYQSEVNRRQAAQSVGKEFNVDPSTLMELNSTEAMKREAKWIQYVNTNNERVTAVERKLVPDQNFADGGQGTQSVNSDNIDALYLEWENKNTDPTLVNPFEARYRTFLAK